MAYAFMRTGDRVLVVPDGFQFRAAAPYRTSVKHVTVPDPAKGQLTNPNDLAVVGGLRDVAAKSESFSCGQIFAARTRCPDAALCNPFACYYCERRGSNQRPALRPSLGLHPSHSKLLPKHHHSPPATRVLQPGHHVLPWLRLHGAEGRAQGDPRPQSRPHAHAFLPVLEQAQGAAGDRHAALVKLELHMEAR